MRPRIAAFVLALAVAIAAVADTATEMLRARGLMDSGEWAEAARAYSALTQEQERWIAENGAGTTPVGSLLRFMFNEAGCLYMLDDYAGLTLLADSIEGLATRFADAVDADLALDLKAYTSKLRGSAEYGLTDSDPRAFDRAERYYLEARENAWEGDTMFINVIDRELAQLYYKWALTRGEDRRYADALERLRLSAPGGMTPLLLSQQAIIKARMASSDSTDDTARETFASALSDIDRALSMTPRGDKGLAEMKRKKAKILMLEQERLATDRYREARRLYEEYIDYQKRAVDQASRSLADGQRRQAWLALHPYLYDCWRLGPRGADLAYDLALYTKGYLLRPRGEKVATWKQVKRALGKEEAAVEFAVFDGRLKALVLTPDAATPRLVDVADMDSLMAHRVKLRMTVGETMRSQDKQAHKNKNYLYGDTTVFAGIWQPVIAAAPGARRIYFAPDGPLHQLAIEYIVPSPEVEAVRLSSTARLLSRGDSRAIASGSMLLVGGVDYYTDNESAHLEEGNDADAYAYLSRKPWHIAYLEGSLREVRHVEGVRGRDDDTMLTDSAATEQAVREAVGRHPVTLISTHGYFDGSTTTGTDLKPQMADNALSQAGLIFAGAGTALDDPGFTPSRHDGVLSATEISHQDWSNTRLIILSACQTGLGYITADGVYGLQRGLKMSGADAMIVSLWEVSDEATSRLMSCFFEELQDGGSARSAFGRARSRLIAGGDEEGLTAPARMSRASLSRQRAPEGAAAARPFPEPCYNCAFITIDLF